MKKNLIVVSVLALALALSPFSGIGATGVSAGAEDTSAVVVRTVSGGDSVSGSDNTETELNAATLKKVSNILDGSGTTDEKVASLRLLGTREVGYAMMKDSELLGKVATLEEDYMKMHHIKVDVPSGVSIIGAAFSANWGSTVKLQMEETAEPETFKEDIMEWSSFGINNYVTLDIDLSNDGISMKGELQVPVVITMSLPAELDSSKKIWIWHYVEDGREWPSCLINEETNEITFSTARFSPFVFIETESRGSSSSSGGSSSGSNYLAALESQIAAAAPGTIVKITKDQNINSLSNSVMKQLVKRGDVALDMEYTYDGVDYHIVIPAGLAEDNDIPWYGPLYLSACYSIYALNTNVAAPGSSVYVVQKGDTMSGIARANNTTVADLAVKNPQIKNVNRIVPGQIITIE